MLKHILFIHLLVVYSCVDQVKGHEENSDTSGLDTITKEPDPVTLYCLFSNPDTAAAGISLRDEKSVLSVLGKEMHLISDKTTDFYSSDKKQTLGLKVHPGDMVNQVSIIKIEYSENTTDNLRQTEVEEFETSNGIKLGMNKADIIAKLGTCYVAKDSTSEGMEMYFSLELPDDSNTKLLTRTNMPVYYASYKLKNDRLDHIKFGFEMP